MESSNKKMHLNSFFYKRVSLFIPVLLMLIYCVLYALDVHKEVRNITQVLCPTLLIAYFYKYSAINSFDITQFLKIKSNYLYIFLGLLVISYAFGIIYNPEWITFWDDSTFSLGTWAPFTGGDRLVPLAAIQHLPIVLLGKGGIPFFYSLMNLLIFTITISIFYYAARITFKEYIRDTIISKNASAVAAILFLLLGPLVAQLYFRIVFQEIITVFFLSIFILLFSLANKNKGSSSSIYYLLAFIFANLILYSKESNFIPIACIGVMMIIFNTKARSRTEITFGAGLIVSSLIFLIFYYINKSNSFQYSTSYLQAPWISNHITTSTIKNYRNLFGLPAILCLIAFQRLHILFIKKDFRLLFFDTLFFAGLSLSAGYFAIKFTFSWYFIPSYMLISIPICMYMIETKNKRRIISFLSFYFMAYLSLNLTLNLSSIYANQVARSVDMTFLESILTHSKRCNSPIYTPKYHQPLFDYVISSRKLGKSEDYKFIHQKSSPSSAPGIMFGYLETKYNKILFKENTSHYDYHFPTYKMTAYEDKRLKCPAQDND